jgi:ketosteroid isomerase-like protein
VSEENVEIVRSIYEAVNRGDWDAAFRDQPADAELTTPPGIDAGTYRGREQIQRYYEGLQAPFAAWTSEPEEFAESGDQVAGQVVQHATWLSVLFFVFGGQRFLRL